MGIRCMALWAQTDDKDKSAEYPEGQFMLGGSFEIEAPVDITIKAGTALGVAIRRNKLKDAAHQNAPDYYGEIYTKKERNGGQG